jgi:hypothetical protein
MQLDPAVFFHGTPVLNGVNQSIVCFGQHGGGDPDRFRFIARR